MSRRQAEIASKPLKVAIVGYTPHRALAPYGDPSWEIWGLNDLYLQKLPGFDFTRLRWFVMHPWDQRGADGQAAMYSSDRAHTQVLQGIIRDGGRLYLKEQRPEIPGAIAYPYAEVYEFFKGKIGADLKYFTNTISFEIALAIMEGAVEIGIYGVDMMTGGRGAINNEYGYQRPSCEYWIAAAEFSGIKVTLPDSSDLMKSAYIYGDYDGSLFRKKIEQQMEQRHGVVQALRQQQEKIQADINQHIGAVAQLESLYNTWLPGDDGSPNAPAPQPKGKSARTGKRIVEENLIQPPLSDSPVNRIVELVYDA